MQIWRKYDDILKHFYFFFFEKKTEAWYYT